MAFDWAADALILTEPYVKNWKLVGGATAFWFAVHIGFVLFWSILFPSILPSIKQNMIDDDAKKGKPLKSDKFYSYRSKFDLYVKSTAWAHALVSSFFALYAVAHFPLNGGLSSISAYDSTPIYALASAISAGYFFYDFAVSVYDMDPQYILHGGFSFIIFAHSSYPFFAYFGALFLCFEISTVFLHMRWFLISTRQAGSKIFSVIHSLFVATFIGIRLVWGPVVSFGFFQPQAIRLFFTEQAAPQSFARVLTRNAEIAPASGDLLNDVAGKIIAATCGTPLGQATTGAVLGAKVTVPHSYVAAGVFAVSNALLQLLNVYWVYMIVKSQARQKSRTPAAGAAVEGKPAATGAAGATAGKASGPVLTASQKKAVKAD